MIEIVVVLVYWLCDVVNVFDIKVVIVCCSIECDDFVEICVWFGNYFFCWVVGVFE